MATSRWTVKPESSKIELAYVTPDGDTAPFWIKVKQRLNVGEQRRIMTAGWRGMTQGRATPSGEQAPAEISIDWRAQSFARAEEYLTEWSLEDDLGKRLPLTRETLESLSPDVFALIETAITVHVAAFADDQKKVPTGSAVPATT